MHATCKSLSHVQFKMRGIRLPIILLQLYLALSTDLPNLIVRFSAFLICYLNLYFRAPVSAVLYTAFVSCRHIYFIVMLHSALLCRKYI